MSTATFVFLKKMVLAKPAPSFTVAVLLGVLLCIPHGALASTVTIAAGTPTAPGSGTVRFTIYDDKSGKNTGELTVTIPEDSNCTVKASLMWAAIKAKIDGDADLKKIFTMGPGPEGTRRSFTITDKDGAMRVNWVPPDSTGEKSGLKVNGNVVFPAGDPRKGSSGAGSTTWLFTFIIWLADDSNVIVPDGTVMTMTAQKPGRVALPVSVTGDGILTVAQLQQMAINQFEALGVSFTAVTDPVTGVTGFMSQSFPGTQSQGGGRVNWNAAWSTYLGGAGVDGAPVP
jgi:hypothetical protein